MQHRGRDVHYITLSGEMLTGIEEHAGAGIEPRSDQVQEGYSMDLTECCISYLITDVALDILGT